MTTRNNQDSNQTEKDKAETKSNNPADNTTIENSGSPGRTPGAAEGDEATIDADIREREAEGKL